MRFAYYINARFYAERIAKENNLDVAIRKVKEYGQVGYNVSFACKNDSDYARAEIVKPRG